MASILIPVAPLPHSGSATPVLFYGSAVIAGLLFAVVLHVVVTGTKRQKDILWNVGTGIGTVGWLVVAVIVLWRL